MNSILRKTAMLVLGAVVFVGGFTWDGRVSSITEMTLIAPAFARVGRPLTPVSYAGVARRTTRRAVAVGAAAAPAPVVVVQPAPTTCVETVAPNGVVTRTCR